MSTSPAEPQVRVFPDLEALSQAAAAFVVAQAEAAVRARGRFSLGLAGGSTPRRTYELLGTAFRAQMPWEKTHLFWGDERFVPPESEDSNFRMAREALISHVPIPEENVHRVPTEKATPEAAAEAYDATLRQFFGDEENGLDVVQMGIGEDGHTASIFPEILGEDHVRARGAWDGRWVVAVEGPPRRPPRDRVTLTLPALCRARQALFLVTGEAKREPLRTLLESAEEERRPLPAAHVRPAEALVWFADEAAYGAEG